MRSTRKYCRWRAKWNVLELALMVGEVGEGRGGNVSLGAYHPLPLLRKLTVCDGKEI